ncbi:MAG: sigma 54-interacting transcriptional regulator [Acidobacteriota bacterium]|jgi:transcriptional regulator with PAS, ATPase and Fis domain
MALSPVGRSPAFKAALQLAGRVAPESSPVVLCGATGTGKSLFARYMHEQGSHPSEPFLEWHAASVPETLLESEILGIEPGAATDVTGKPGLFEATGEGTLCLTGLESLSPHQQAVLLRILENHEVERLGGRRKVKVRVRILASFQTTPEILCAQGRLRRDLLYRLDVFRLELPPLNQRTQDIPLLAAHFMSELARRRRKKAPKLAPALQEAFERHLWRGNIRELAQVLERLYLLGKDVVGPPDLPPSFWKEDATIAGALERGLTLSELKEAYIYEVLGRVGGSRTEAAKWLGISRKALWEYLKRSSS